MKEYNILNGDCLKHTIKDEYSNLLVIREAFSQGPIEDKDEKSFFENRALFISEVYKACTKDEYLNGLDEFNRIKNIEKSTIINLWFGKDVFCQVNFWFILNYLKDKISTNSFYLISPQEDQKCNFDNKEKRDTSYKNKTALSKKSIEAFCELWDLYKKQDYTKMKEKTYFLKKEFPFINETIDAIINRENIESEFLEISKKEKDFRKLFRNFINKYPIYGYGDLQVKYILEKN